MNYKAIILISLSVIGVSFASWKMSSKQKQQKNNKQHKNNYQSLYNVNQKEKKLFLKKKRNLFLLSVIIGIMILLIIIILVMSYMFYSKKRIVFDKDSKQIINFDDFKKELEEIRLANELKKKEEEDNKEREERLKKVEKLAKNKKLAKNRPLTTKEVRNKYHSYNFIIQLNLSYFDIYHSLRQPISFQKPIEMQLLYSSENRSESNELFFDVIWDLEKTEGTKGGCYNWCLAKFFQTTETLKIKKEIKKFFKLAIEILTLFNFEFLWWLSNHENQGYYLTQICQHFLVNIFYNSKDKEYVLFHEQLPKANIL